MKKIISFLISLSVVFPVFVSAQTVNNASAQAQIQSLLQQLSQLQNQLNGTKAAPMQSASPATISIQAFTTTMTVGSQGQSVSALQQILISDGYLTAITTPSGYFGQATKAALVQYQQANGISPATGYFGQLTMANMNAKNIGGKTTQPVPQPATASNQTLPTTASQPAALPQGNTSFQSTVPTPSSHATNYSQNWSSYAIVSFQNLLDDPSFYLGKNIQLTGVVEDFLGNGGRGGTQNYVEIADPKDASSITSRVMLQVDDGSNYHTATQALNSVANVRLSGNLFDSVIAFGDVVANESFVTTDGGEVSVPVVEITRLDKCNLLLCSGGGATTLFLSSIVSNANATPTQTGMMTSSAPSSPRYFQLNVQGSCDNYGNGSIVLNGYPYVSGYSIPGSDINAWSNGMVAFTVPSTVSSGTYQVDIRGYEPNTGYCADVSGGSITVGGTSQSASTGNGNAQTQQVTPALNPAPQTVNQNISPASTETVSQINAVKEAKSYLGYSAFSHDGLIAQLEYEQFSHTDAVFGADNSGANWNDQAVAEAKAYMGYSAFSRGSLIAQLEFDKFTQAQAEYGASAVGL